MNPRSISVFVSLLAVVSGTARAQVVVDGNLTDLAAVAQASQADQLNEICPFGKSGFDFSHAYAYYDGLNDQLFLGLDIADVPPTLGVPGPGVPGDADGDGNPDTSSPNNPCVAPPFFEQPGVGQDEEYTFFVDTNDNGTISDMTDVRITYRGNQLGFFAGSTNTPIPGASGVIRLGTAGAGGVNTAIPDADENTATTDVELRVDRWSSFDAVPWSFSITVRSGSLVDGLPEDVANLVVNAAAGCDAGTVATGGGSAADVLRINGSTGGPTRTIETSPRAPVAVSLSASPAGPATNARYVAWAWTPAGVSPTPLQVRGTTIGCTLNPTPVSPGPGRQPAFCLRGTGIPMAACSGSSTLSSPPRAPWTATRAAGFATPVVLTLQGVIEDSGAANALHLSVTNAVTLVVR